MSGERFGLNTPFAETDEVIAEPHRWDEIARVLHEVGEHEVGDYVSTIATAARVQKTLIDEKLRAVQPVIRALNLWLSADSSEDRFRNAVKAFRQGGATTEEEPHAGD